MVGVELEEAISLILKSIDKIEKYEELNLIEAEGRVISDDIFAPINNPPFNRSPLDGYVLIDSDTKSASRKNPKKLKVIDRVFAGGYSKKVLSEGEAIRIMTGAKIPEGANCVIRQENTDYGIDEVEIYEELSAYDNYCFSGEDIKKGDLLIKNDEVLSYVHLGILSSMGYEKVKVKVKPKIALIITGDEVCRPGETLNIGKIYDSNLHLISARLSGFGLKPTNGEIVSDSEEKLGLKITEIINEVDLIITTGGVSVGERDILHEVLPMIGAKRVFWKVNLMPGTPAIYSLYKDKPILSLSGNPFAALATFELLARPILAKLSGNDNLKTKNTIGIMKDEFNKKSSKRRFIRARFENGVVSLLENKHSSGMLASMIGCNCLIDIKKGTEKLGVGDMVNVVLL